MTDAPTTADLAADALRLAIHIGATPTNISADRPRLYVEDGDIGNALQEIIGRLTEQDDHLTVAFNWVHVTKAGRKHPASLIVEALGN